MMHMHRPRTLVWAMIAMFAITVSAALSPAMAGAGHHCGPHLQTDHAPDDADRHPMVPGCCAGMQCCPIVPEPAPGFAVIPVGLVPPVRVDLEDPLILDQDIDPPPRFGSI
ncbi:hypothetical protein CYG48_13285 [Neorhizobium sp. SOG26]|jgi:hypothetical protein|uniref:hypothetical protein n=1 Tax=Neorhizobium sp. SOG26 TaxID=2060726 RepID=UPI000E585CD1|nr:hypothetical protein [Neorhizobium sp. SOG26]AXV16577.1 hypothetical protein CYG48_13285 [Neorhizobium sp. SOG26]QCM14046.1 hypothetical protein CFBP6625_26840 [Agrobacterium tumefaciens]